ncbi:VOC family protein [Saccharothrix sp.]|uniref:VOC family protein n=1 Tax=Saccharothrix sp. TaxID=1873460 RepID=UPI002810A9B1|nr:VOC family protein [Saccharothrix sp.]
MLTDTRTATVLPVSDMERATHFYTDQLGLTQSGTSADGSRRFDLGFGNELCLLPTEEGSQSKHTVLSFEVSDISSEIRQLEARGVRFEDYDMPDLKTVDHIADMGGEKAAWFCDSEGNYLCLHEVPGR